jgi:hypothetical protein
MSPDDNTEDSAARKARADAIRRARDRRNERLNAPVAPTPPGTASTDEDTVASPSSAEGGDANYVEFIDRKMREKKTNS